jgi:hypothetical protein
MEFDAQRLPEAGTISNDAVVTWVGTSPTCKTKLPKSPRKVDVPSVACQKESTKVKYNDKEGGPNAFSNYGRLQLLIFNVYGTLLDCSLLLERNPNSKIRTSLKTETRRVVF